MIWGETKQEWRERVYNWRPWFAWRPVHLKDGRWAFWEYVERCGYISSREYRSCR